MQAEGVPANAMVVGTAARHVLIYDSRKFSEPLQTRESSLKYQVGRIPVLQLLFCRRMMCCHRSTPVRSTCT